MAYQRYCARLSETADNGKMPIATQDGWHSRPYTAVLIDNIIDTGGASVQTDITSIPSPLAQMHVYDEAFKIVAAANKSAAPISKKPTPFERLVSDCLDVWEIMANYSSHSGLDFVKWNKAQAINALCASPLPEHQLLGNTLQLYLGQSNTMSIQAIDDLYFISYHGQVFAGTSPFTGFFLTPNSLTNIQLLDSNNLPYFSHTNIKPLKDRSLSFQTFVASVIKAFQAEMNVFCKNFYDYCFYQLSVLSPHAAQLNTSVFNVAYTPAQLQKDYPHTIVSSEGVTMHLNYQTGQVQMAFSMPYHPLMVDATCQLVIAPTKPFSNSQQNTAAPTLPLVLTTNIVGNYVNGKPLPTGVEIPLDVVDAQGNSIALAQRKLPVYNIAHPYLTAGDFIQEYLLDVGYTINDDAFFTGKLVGFNNDFSYLLPIKPLFFRYFTMADLYTMLTITKEQFDVVVSLDIPLSGGGKVKLSRKFKHFTTMPSRQQVHQSNAENGGTNGVGAIVSAPVGMTLSPIVKVAPTAGQRSSYNDYFKVGLISQPLSGLPQLIGVEFLREADHANEELQVETPTAAPQNTHPGLHKRCTFHNGTGDPLDPEFDYYILGDNYATGNAINSEFDFMALSFNNSGVDTAQAVVCPKWQMKAIGTNGWDVAIDFGTSNTFVAYLPNQGQPKAFDIDTTDLQLVRLDKPSQQQGVKSTTEKFENLLAVGGNMTTAITTEAQRQCEVPSVMGVSNDAQAYKMPFTTAIAHERGANLNLDAANTAIPFALSRHKQIAGVEVHTNVKWDNIQVGSPESLRLDLFMKQLLRMLRNKVLLGGGNPSQTRLRWFKPVSMSAFRQSQFASRWQTHMNHIFQTPSTNVPICITESEAPYHLHLAQGKLGGGTCPVVSIDVGGGTTDILVFHLQQPIMAHSSMMASRALFGEVLAKRPTKQTPILNYYTPIVNTVISQLKSDPQKSDLGNSLDHIHQDFLNEPNYRAEDIIGFYFSQPEFEFAARLGAAQSPFKLTFLFFFTALHYHCATLLRDQGLEPPRDICLSGNGSRMIDIVCQGAATQGSVFAEYVSEIYRAVMNNPFNHCITLHTRSNPKEATALGGLCKNVNTNAPDTKAKTVSEACVGEILHDLRTGQVAQTDSTLTYGDLGIGGQAAQYGFKARGSEYLAMVELFTGHLYQRFNFNDTFGIPCNIAQVRQWLTDEGQVEADFAQAFTLLNQEKQAGDLLNETLFFYPVYAALTRLSQQLLQQAQMAQKAHSTQA